MAAVGVSVSVFNLVSKLFNVPLLNITTSFVAEEQALVSKSENESIQIGQGTFCEISYSNYFLLYFPLFYLLYFSFIDLIKVLVL